VVGFQNGNLPQQEYNIDFGKFPLWGLAKSTAVFTEIKFPDWELEIQHAKVPSWHFATEGAEKNTSSYQFGNLRCSIALCCFLFFIR